MPLVAFPYCFTSPTQPFPVGADRVGSDCVDPDMIPPGFEAGCYYDPIGPQVPNGFISCHTNRSSGQRGCRGRTATSSGAMTTESGLMFHTEADGTLGAYEQRTGDRPWQFQDRRDRPVRLERVRGRTGWSPTRSAASSTSR